MQTAKVLIRRNPQFGQCPSCKKVGTLHRSRSKTMTEQIMRKVSFFRIYRCKECGWRGFRSTLVITRKSLRNVFMYFLLVCVTAYVVQYLIANIVPH